MHGAFKTGSGTRQIFREKAVQKGDHVQRKKCVRANNCRASKITAAAIDQQQRENDHTGTVSKSQIKQEYPVRRAGSGKITDGLQQLMVRFP